MRHLRFAAFAVVIALALVHGPAGAEPTRGDVNGDGRVDGADALLVLRHVRGLATLTEEQRARADVSPLPGADGRVIGDGSITQADAEQLLRYTVGLVSRGEVTGDFDGPLITEFQPAAGTPGTQVKISGANLVASTVAEYVVEFGGASARVLSGSAAEITAEVPAGAVTGPIRVRTPGGEALSRASFTVTTPAAGRARLPAGMQASQFTAVTSWGTSALDAEGGFNVPVNDEAPTLVALVPNADNAENVLLAFALPPQGRQALQTEISARSTAEGFIAMQPLFLTNDPEAMRVLADTMSRVPEVAQLAALIERKWPAGGLPADDAEFQALLQAAVTAVNDALPASEKLDLSVDPGALPASTRAAAAKMVYLDISALKPTLQADDNEVLVQNLIGNPLDWVLRLAQVSPDDADFARGPNLVPADAVFDRLAYSSLATAPANSFSGKFISFDFLVSEVLKGLKPVTHLELGADEDAVYALRMVSGVLRDASEGRIDSSILARMPGDRLLGYSSDYTRAITVNAVSAAMEVLYLLVDLKTLLPSRTVTQELIAKMVDTFVKSFSQQFPGLTYAQIRQLSGGEIGRRLYVILLDLVKEGIKIACREIPKVATKPYAKLFKFVDKVLLKSVRLVTIWGQIGRLAERVAGFTGHSLLGANSITPLESALIVVGDPFGLKITEFPGVVGTGETVSLKGGPFAETPEGNEVFFGAYRATVSEVRNQQSELRVVVPAMPASTVTLVVRRQNRQGRVGPVQVKRTPVISRVLPDCGFPAGTFQEREFTGTLVTIEGAFFDKVNDKVRFANGENWVDAQVQAYGSSAERLVVSVPAGARGERPIRVETTEGRSGVSPAPFRVLGAPILMEIGPAAAQAGETVWLVGAHFPASRYEAVVEFTSGGTTTTQSNPTVRNDRTLETTMPGQVAEGATASVRVVTPAGASNALTITRLAGRARGGTIEDVTPSTEVRANGVVSLAEALDFVQGRRDIYSVDQLWDDSDLDVVISQTHVYTRSGSDWNYVRSDYALVSATRRSPRGHSGKETAYTQVKVYERKATTTFLNESSETINLDDPAITSIHGIKVAGIGKVEEGDHVRSASGEPDDKLGADFADSFQVDLGGQTLALNVNLTQTGAGDDTIRVYGGTLQGAVTLQTGGNHLHFSDDRGHGTVVTGKVTITGDHNQVDAQDSAIRGGLAIRGGSGNDWLNGEIGAVGTRLAIGVEISGAARENRIRQASVLNATVGIRVTGASAQHNRVAANVGWKTGVQAPCATGVEISAGAHDNQLGVSVQYCTGDGVVVRGAGTDANEVNAGHSGAANGARVKEGARGNVIVTGLGNAGHGVLVEGDRTDNNHCVGGYGGPTTAGNAGAEVAVLGAGAAAPVGTIIEGVFHTGTVRGQASVLLRNLQKQGSPSVTVRDCYFYTDADPGVPGLVLENVKGALIERNRFNLQDTPQVPGRGHSVAILLKGAQTCENTLRLNFVGAPTVAGLHLTDGAHHNLVENLQVFRGANWHVGEPIGEMGVLIEGKASHNQLRVRDDLRLRMGGYGDFRGGFILAHRVGVMVRGGASENLLQGFIIYYAEQSVAIEGAGTNKNVVQACTLGNSQGPSTVAVTDGAADSVIGSEVPELGNDVFPGQEPAVLVKAAPRTTICGNYLAGAGPAVVRVVSGDGVRIGTVQQAGGNMIAQAATADASGVWISAGANAVVEGNQFLFNAGGPVQPTVSAVLVDGTATDTSIGGLLAGRGNSIAGYPVGIRITGAGVRGAKVTQNEVYGNDTGILLDGGVRGARVADNHVTYHDEDGIRIEGQGTSGNLIEQNYVADSGRHGISIAGATENRLRDNYVTSSRQYGIALGAGTGRNTVLGGSIMENTAGGISAPAPAAPRITQVRPGEVLGDVPDSVPSSSLVQVYADQGSQGRQYLGQARVHGKAWRLQAALPQEMNITATVTDLQGNTSAFGETGAPSVRPPLFGGQSLTFTSTRDGNAEIYRRAPGANVDTRLTTNAAADHSPAIAPTGGSVAFVSERSGNAEIWRLSPYGDATPLTNSPAPEYDPAFSPDGRKVLFASERDGNPEIYVMDADGRNLLRLTDSPGVDRYPAFSPDGSKIAFTSHRGGNPDIWVMNADGTNPLRLTTHAAADYDATWAPDGQRLAFVSERAGNPEIYLMAATGTGVTRLTQNAAVDRDPVWSADGQWVAFSSNREGDAEIFAAAAAGTRVERLTVSLGANTQPCWLGGLGGRAAALVADRAAEAERLRSRLKEMSARAAAAHAPQPGP